ncbi:unnamed protein product [Rhizoctonia solani]|uniref:GPI anchored protein n=1 Tax=Rhizoctonia solani TaxID=456999 RepID=A0A8H3BRF9_9AGAM|nr:unnamed protein product [Rhizoctonia solani]
MHTTMRLITKLFFFSLLPVVLADLWGFTPDEPVGTSPNVNLLVRQQYYCPSGYGVCPNRRSCCPLGGRCCSAGGCCGSGYYCVSGGCCPLGEICTGGVRGCSVSGTYPCKNESFCCPSGATCYRDSSGTPRCGSGGGDPDPDPTTRTTKTTIRATSTSTSTSTSVTSWTSYTTISYETMFGMTLTYTFVVEEGSTRTVVIGVPSTVPSAPTSVPGIVTPTVTPPSIPTPPVNSTSSTSARAAAFTAQFNSGTIDHYPISISILVVGFCLLALY